MGGTARKTSFTAVVSALYAVLTILPGYLSFGPIQLRIADMLIPLSAIYGVPACIAVTAGCLVANAYYFVGWMDVVFGPLANLAASLLIYRMRDRLLPATVLASFIVGFTVGGYLWLFLPPPDVGLPIHPAILTGLTVSGSSLITISILGYILVRTLERILPSHMLRI